MRLRPHSPSNSPRLSLASLAPKSRLTGPPDRPVRGPRHKPQLPATYRLIDRARRAVLPHRPQNLLLLAASYYFYSCWDYRFTSLLLISTVMDYFCGLAVDRVGDDFARA